jgi:hypothetical protein
MDLESIKRILDTEAGSTLREYLISKLDELKNIDNVTEKDTAVTQALEVKSQKRAYNKLKEILKDILTFSESVKAKDPRDSYGITDDDISD